PLAIARLDVDRADAVLQHHHFKSLLAGVQHRRPHAVVGGQAADEQAVDLVLAQPAGQLGAVERRVGFSVAVDAFAPHLLDPTPGEVRVELGAGSAGLAVHRPRPSPRLEGDVVSRVPVAAGHHQRRALGGAVEGREDGVATRHGEGSAGTEVNLRIDYEKRVARPEGHGHPAYYWLASGPQRA